MSPPCKYVTPTQTRDHCQSTGSVYVTCVNSSLDLWRRHAWTFYTRVINIVSGVFSDQLDDFHNESYDSRRRRRQTRPWEISKAQRIHAFSSCFLFVLLYVCVPESVCVCRYVLVYVFVCACTYVCTRFCTCVCGRVYMCVYVRVIVSLLCSFLCRYCFYCLFSSSFPLALLCSLPCL